MLIALPLIIVLWLAQAAAPAVIAQRKGRKPLAYFASGVALPVVSTMVALLMQNDRPHVAAELPRRPKTANPWKNR